MEENKQARAILYIQLEKEVVELDIWLNKISLIQNTKHVCKHQDLLHIRMSYKELIMLEKVQLRLFSKILS